MSAASFHKDQLRSHPYRTDIVGLRATAVPAVLLLHLGLGCAGGFVVLHDCNAPTIYHAREDYHESNPAGRIWNGSSWKAFQRFRSERENRCFVVDTDYGVGVIVNHQKSPEYQLSRDANPFYEYRTLEQNRRGILNLISAKEFEEVLPTLT